MDERMSMEPFERIMTKKKTEVLQGVVSQCHFFRHKCHME
jgi:hypothetical protein